MRDVTTNGSQEMAVRNLPYVQIVKAPIGINRERENYLFNKSNLVFSKSINMTFG